MITSAPLVAGPAAEPDDVASWAAVNRGVLATADRRRRGFPAYDDAPELLLELLLLIDDEDSESVLDSEKDELLPELLLHTASFHDES